MKGKYVLMPDNVVSAAQLIRLYRLRPGEYIDASRPHALRGRNGALDVPLYPIYRRNDPRAEGKIYEEVAKGIELYREQAKGELFNAFDLEVPGHLYTGEPYRK